MKPFSNRVRKGRFPFLVTSASLSVDLACAPTRRRCGGQVLGQVPIARPKPRGPKPWRPALLQLSTSGLREDASLGRRKVSRIGSEDRSGSLCLILPLLVSARPHYLGSPLEGDPAHAHVVEDISSKVLTTVRSYRRPCQRA